VDDPLCPRGVSLSSAVRNPIAYPIIRAGGCGTGRRPSRGPKTPWVKTGRSRCGFGSRTRTSSAKKPSSARCGLGPVRTEPRFRRKWQRHFDHRRPVDYYAGQSGIVGLAAVTAIFLVPGIRFWWRTKAPTGRTRRLPRWRVLRHPCSLRDRQHPQCHAQSRDHSLHGAVSAASLTRRTPASASAQVVSQQLPLRKSPYRRALWPPQQAPAGTASQWDVAARGERSPTRRGRASQGPHWRR